MLLGQLPDLRETQSGKDLIAIGRQEGRQEGERAGLIWLLEAKFGVLDAVTRDRIEAIDSMISGLPATVLNNLPKSSSHQDATPHRPLFCIE